MVPQGLDNRNAGPFWKLLDRLKSFSRPTLSSTARCTGFNTFILSVMPYTISYFGLTTLDLNRLRQAVAKFMLKRHWLEAEILPYVLRYFGIATLLDPAMSATIAAIGLYLREGDPIEDLTRHPGREECCNTRQKSVVMELLDLWSPFLGIEELIGALSEGNGPITKRLNALKRVILTRMVQEARSRITKKIFNEGWSGGISPGWVALVTEAPRAWCLVGVQRILPLDYSTMHLPTLIGINTADVLANSQLAVLPLNSPVVAALREMELSVASMQSNVQVRLITCDQ